MYRTVQAHVHQTSSSWRGAHALRVMSFLRAHNVVAHGVAYEGGQRRQMQFAHDCGPMSLHGLHSNVQGRSYPSIGVALDDQSQHTSFASVRFADERFTLQEREGEGCS